MQLIVSPSKSGLFEATLDGRAICTSRQPFVDAARVLIAEGCDRAIILTMRHAGSDTVALTAKLGVAAKWSVGEDAKFHRWLIRILLGKKIDLNDYCLLASTMVRVATRLGLKRRAKDVSQPALGKYLAADGDTP